jgi:hypothetical protein
MDKIVHHAQIKPHANFKYFWTSGRSLFWISNLEVIWILENQFCSENWARPIAIVPVGFKILTTPAQLADAAGAPSFDRDRRRAAHRF